MTMTAFGDAARMHGLGVAGTKLRSDLARLSQEIATGVLSDPGTATDGNFDRLAANRRGLALNASYTRAIDAAVGRADVTQAVFDRVAGEIEGIAPRLLELSRNGDYHDLVLTNAAAHDRLDATIAALNTRIGGVAVLGGDDPTAAPLVDAEAMLAALRPLVDAAPDAATAIAAVEDWFQTPGAGFDTTAWQGGDGDPPAVLVAEGHRIDAAMTARDPALRVLLTGLSLAALSAEGAGPPGQDAARDITAAAAQHMQAGEVQLIGLRAVLGADQERLDQARATAEATRAGLDLDFAAQVGADPYETATAIEEVQFRLQSLYVVTARVAGLSLTEYIR